MNHSYRVVFNRNPDMWQTVSQAKDCKLHRPHTPKFAFLGRPLNFRATSLNTALVFAGLLIASNSGFAQSTDWSAGGGGDWAAGGNWTSGTPTGATTARLSTAGDQVTLNGVGTAQELQVQGAGEVIVGAGGSLAVGGIINLGTVAGAGAARLTIQGGGTVSATHLFAGDAPRQGIVTVTGAGSTLTLAPVSTAQGDRFEIGGNGAGELHIDAGANVTVNGTRTLHVGDTANGTLSIGNGAGAGTLTADNVILGTTGSSVQFNHTGTTTFSAAVSGNGSLTKTGTGITTLTGANSYTGGTALNGGGITVGNATALGTGRLTVGSGSSLDSSTVIALGNAVTLNSNLTVAGSNALSLNGNITGAGGLIKNGASSLTLGGANTFSGTVALNAGGLVLASNSALGSGALNAAGGTTLDAANAVTANNNVNLAGNLSIGGSADLTLAGTVAGVGRLTKNGTANVTLSGSNNFLGGVTLNAGSLTVGNAIALGSGSLTVGGNSALDSSTGVTLSNNVILNANLAAGGANALTMGGVISGAGSLTKVGAGTLTLTGTNLYTGGTTVSAGTLTVNGTLSNAAVTVNNGGTLGGSGTVGSTTIATGGVLAPGNSIGTLTVNGNVTFAAGSIYRVEVDAAGANDRINATGTATLNGGMVDVQAGAGTYQASTQYTILNAAGGRTGNFAGVTSNLAFLTPTLAYDANNVYLNLARNGISFSNVAATPNQRATSSALERAAVGASGDLSTVLTAVTGSSADQARAAYDAIGGAGLVELRRAAPAFANNFGNQLHARLNAVGVSASTISLNGIQLATNDHINDLMPMLAQAPQQKFTLAGGTPQTTTDTRGFWLRAYGSDQATDSDGNAAGNRIKDAGISVGFDTTVSNDLVIGAAFTHGSADINTDNSENGRSRGNAVALYGNYAVDAWNFNGSATIARNGNSMQRRIAFGGIDRIAQSNFDSDTAALYGEATYDVAMNGWTLQPLMGLSLSRNKSDAFTETGADALNLQVASQTVNSAKTLFGAKAIFDFNKVQLQPRVIWSHEFGDANSAMTTQLQGAPTPFVISGVDLPRDTLITGVTIVGRTSDRLSLFADMQGEFNSQQTNLGLLVGLRANW